MTDHKRRYIQPPPTAPRPPEAKRLLADLETVETAGLRAAIELRGFGEHDLADMLADVIERVYTIHGAAGLRLRGAVTVSTGGEGRG